MSITLSYIFFFFSYNDDSKTPHLILCTHFHHTHPRYIPSAYPNTPYITCSFLSIIDAQGSGRTSFSYPPHSWHFSATPTRNTGTHLLYGGPALLELHCNICRYSQYRLVPEIKHSFVYQRSPTVVLIVLYCFSKSRQGCYVYLRCVSCVSKEVKSFTDRPMIIASFVGCNT